MSDTPSDEVDAVLSEILGDIGQDSDEDLEQRVTFGQSDSEEEQKNIIEENID